MTQHYQPPSPSSSDGNSSINSVGLSRQRSASAEFPLAKRTRPSQHQSVNEWAASLGQAELSGLTVHSPIQIDAVRSSLPTPASTPPHLAATGARGAVGGATVESVTMAKVLARAAALNAQGAFAPVATEVATTTCPRSHDEAEKDRVVTGLVGKHRTL